ncbi:hypothetical protein AVEN_25685-1 [Araneus ventricosus]|uniref:Mos1 transposase HTH domain-containing protein n=1 Tax=Araneus ventricosus TaxID=182803 RepID=A0A4Y2QI54_ARAVE|nr:hypothetical protein AVEN_25685-1 [Araneus ventricosus]
MYIVSNLCVERLDEKAVRGMEKWSKSTTLSAYILYGEQCLAQCTIFRWYQCYEALRVKIKDLPCPGQEHVVTNSARISAVDELIRQNRRITTREIAVELSISKRTVHHIIHKKLGYEKCCAQWVPKHLSENQKTVRMGVCLLVQSLGSF